MLICRCYLGSGPEFTSFSYQRSTRQVTIEPANGQHQEMIQLDEDETFFEFVHDQLDAYELCDDDDATLPKEMLFRGGLIGCLAYEMKSETKLLSQNQCETDSSDVDAAFYFVDRYIGTCTVRL